MSDVKDKDEVKYLPLQTHIGDLAIYIASNGHEIEFNNEKYIILPYSAILMIIRDENMFK